MSAPVSSMALLLKSLGESVVIARDALNTDISFNGRLRDELCWYLHFNGLVLELVRFDESFARYDSTCPAIAIRQYGC